MPSGMPVRPEIRTLTSEPSVAAETTRPPRISRKKTQPGGAAGVRSAPAKKTVAAHKMMTRVCERMLATFTVTLHSYQRQTGEQRREERTTSFPLFCFLLSALGTSAAGRCLPFIGSYACRYPRPRGTAVPED